MTDVGQIITDVVQDTEIHKVNLDMNAFIKIALTIAIGVLVIRVLMFFVDRNIRRRHSDSPIHKVIRRFINIMLWFLLILVVLDSVGIQVTSLIALFSVVGVAVSLALQSTLSNVAGGMVLLTVKPFQVGHYIIADGVEGTVLDISLSYTTLKTVDNKEIFIPNSQLASAKITNNTSLGLRRLDLFFEASYDDATEEVKAAIREVLDNHPLVHKDPEPVVRLREYGESSIKYEMRAYIDPNDYWTVYFDIQEGVRESFLRHGVQMTYNHVIVHTVDDKS